MTLLSAQDDGMDWGADTISFSRTYDEETMLRGRRSSICSDLAVEAAARNSRRQMSSIAPSSGEEGSHEECFSRVIVVTC
jgi:hypothetical protein